MYKHLTFNYSKKESIIVSGIALCMMFFHHILGFPTWIKNPNECIFLINIGSYNLERILADSCLLCVAIFAFNTGYALYTAKEKFTFKKNLKRIFNFLVSYWIIYFLFLSYGYIFKEELPNFKEFCLNLIGLEGGSSTSINVPFAWYVTFYIQFIFISPIILFCTRGKNLLRDIAFITFWGLLSAVCFLYDINVFSSLFKIGIISLSAYFFTKYNLLSYLKFKTHCDTTLNLILALSILFLRFFVLKFINNYTNYTFSFLQDCFYAPMFILFTTNIIQSLKEESLVKKIFFKIGILSMNMWFIHGIFFTGSCQIQWFLYLPKYSFIVVLWGLLITYFVSIPVSKIQSFLLGKMNNRR